MVYLWDITTFQCLFSRTIRSASFSYLVPVPELHDFPSHSWPPKEQRWSFTSRVPGRRTSVLRIQRERRRKREVRQFGQALFERLLDVMFLPGNDREWIMTQTGVGPLPSIIAKLLRPKFKLSPSMQANLTRLRYFNGANKKSSDLPRMYVFASDDPSRRSYRRRVYKARRFPRLSRQVTDIDPLREWIKIAIENEALSETDPEKAYEIFRQALETHTLVDGQSAYVGYPSPECEHRNPLQSTSSTNIHVRDVNETAEEGQGSEQPRNEGHEESDLVENQVGSSGNDASLQVQARAAEQNDHGDHRGNMEAAESSSLEGQGRVDVFQWNAKCQAVLHRVFETARNDKVFRYLCKISERSTDSKIGLVAGGILETFSESYLTKYPLLADLLE